MKQKCLLRGFTAIEPQELISTILLDMQRSADEHNVKIKLDLSSQLSKPCYLDVTKLRQIITNLVANAIKYGEGSDVTIRAWREANQLKVVVLDGGLGVPDADRDLIFDYFHRVRNMRSSITMGAGLGLPLSRELALALGGSLILSPKSQQPGAEFVLTLPC